jgi:hypothetical protein
VFCSIEHIKPSRKALFVLVWGVLIWGASTALAITLFDRYTTHQVETSDKVVVRFVVFMAGGILWRLLLWNRHDAPDRKKLTQSEGVVRIVFFIGLMSGLVYALRTMTLR